MPEIEPELPSGYAGMLVSLKELVTSAQLRAQQAASNAMIEMYWEIGSTILQRQAAQPWGTKILQRLAADLKSAFPHMRGFSRSNLFYMRAFAAAWDLSDPSVRGRVNGLPWGHIIELLKVKDPAIRDWYAERAVEHKWRLEVLEHQITTGLHRRVGAAPNNLEERLSEDGAPEHLGQLNFYVAAVNDLVKFPGMAPTVGILVCGSKHEPTVRYALDGSS